jgi:hypothetical protein
LFLKPRSFFNASPTAGGLIAKAYRQGSQGSQKRGETDLSSDRRLAAHPDRKKDPCEEVFDHKKEMEAIYIPDHGNHGFRAECGCYTDNRLSRNRENAEAQKEAPGRVLRLAHGANKLLGFFIFERTD